MGSPRLAHVPGWCQVGASPERAGCLSQLPERDDGAPRIDPDESRCTSRNVQAETGCGAGTHSPAAM